MARKNSLREYQTAVAERLRNLSKEELQPYLSWIFGRRTFLVRCSARRERGHSSAAGCPVPLTKPYFCGLTNIRGSLYGVIDFSIFLGLPAVTPGLDSRLCSCRNQWCKVQRFWSTEWQDSRTWKDLPQPPARKMCPPGSKTSTPMRRNCLA